MTQRRGAIGTRLNIPRRGVRKEHMISMFLDTLQTVQNGAGLQYLSTMYIKEKASVVLVLWIPPSPLSRARFLRAVTCLIFEFY